MSYGGIEAGGTKWVCGIGDGDGRVLESESFPRTTPQETIARAAEFFTGRKINGLGIASFGRSDVRESPPTSGYITTRQKAGWAHTAVVKALCATLRIPIVIETDVIAAALAEQRWGAAIGLDTFCYLTVGTGIRGGVIVNGEILDGLLRPEIGHMRIPHDRQRDPFAGVCLYHGDCLEGLASGEAIRRRWGRLGEELGDAAVWELESEYLALGLMNLICTLSPQRIILGGGVAQQATLLPLVRSRLQVLLAGYFDTPELTQAEGIDRFVVAPGLGDQAGLLGAIELVHRCGTTH